jgi:hypothetical protein
VLQGDPPFPSAPRGAPEPRGAPRAAAPAREAPRESIWAVLGLAPGAPTEAIKRAYFARALETHPDRGGDAEAFRRVTSAYEEALTRAKKSQRPRPKRG